MVAAGGKDGRQPHDDAGEIRFPEGKIGSWYMTTIKGQPKLRDTVEWTPRTDQELRGGGKKK